MSRDPDVGNDRDRRAPVVIRDRRRIDPVTLEPRRPADPAVPSAHGTATPPSAHESVTRSAPGGAAGRPAAAELRRARTEAARLRDENAELTADLQRLKAEYDNYRKRVRRDRLAIREIAVTNVLAALLPVLDAFEGAREQGADTGIEAVAKVLGEQLAALGLQSVGAPGEAFDPQTHEAVTYTPSDEAAGPVCTEVLRHGYRVGDHLLRPAQVAVTGPPAGGPVVPTEVRADDGRSGVPGAE
ncbi:nucleotide exchange factor GrpE [Streptomyces peucetius]|uniref:Protein GrpE n=1 Tax=Streptomyces peucetius TaxID=1950 RepID=A0ABY6IGY3_STRPE|nr:nucleotide exchange factor GrpE [Streptomyces peucetius]UYQ66156.1 nucleotide exchange factor GrpE [Streptomyces peucetius]